ncbi:MAG TPA: alpha-ketoacid dehydrogenase subunit beta [Candidatus Marinimicrobia bacterium]|nr:alpha-ketoacid dehydrogenase subunit beta [Candidatus Neomarinimicrobiota bacterium]
MLSNNVLMTYRDAIREGLAEEMKRDDRVCLLGEDIGVYGGAYKVTRNLINEFGPMRVMDTPMSESLIVGAAVGMAIVGLRPFAEIMYIDFSTLSIDQIVNQAAKFHFMTGGRVKVPLVVRMQQGTGRSAAAQHSQSLEAWYAHIPGLKVVLPSTPYDSKGLIKSAIRDENPVVFIEHKGLYTLKGDVDKEEYLIPIGKADIKKEGTDVTIITYSKMVHVALQASQELEAESGISIEVLDLRSLRPIDDDAIRNSVQKTKHVLIVTEANKTLGMSAEIFTRVVELVPDIKEIRRLAGKDTIIGCSPVLENASIPTVEEIKETIRAMMKL